jgi:tRNA A37 threonylcarbamoyladenosine dehydratase
MPEASAASAGSELADPELEAAVDAEAVPTANTVGVSGLHCAGYGSAVVVTATFGFIAAGHVLRKLAQPAKDPALPVAEPQHSVLGDV